MRLQLLLLLLLLPSTSDLQPTQEKHSAITESVYAMESILIAIKAEHKRTAVTLQNG